jgi:hypothetical protein
MKNTNHCCLRVLGMDTSTSSTTHSTKPNVDDEKDKEVPPTHPRVQARSIQVQDQVDPIVQSSTPMTTNTHLNLDVEGKPVDQSLYHSLIGHLLYLTTSRPDFMFGVCLYAQIIFYEAISFGP